MVRRHLFASLLALVAVSAAPAAGAADAPAVRAREALLDPHDPTVLVVAHRGCWKTAAENALSAIEACVAMGVHMVELDVRRTRDGALVLMHDETVDRTTNGSGRVGDLTLAEIARLRLRQGQGGPEAPLTEERVPTFSQALAAAKDRVLINLDAKADVYDQALAEAAAVGTQDQVLMKRRVAAGEPPLRTQPPFDRVLAMPILDQAAGEAAELMAGQAPAPAPVAAELIFSDVGWLVRAAPVVEAAEIRLWVNTLSPDLAAGLSDDAALEDPDAVWGLLRGLGVTLFQTDEPAALLDYLAGPAARGSLAP